MTPSADLDHAGVPRATARLQLHAGFTFADAAALVPYYAGLGISHLYLSPITTARPGSTHGYDVTDFTRINPELGGEAGFLALAFFVVASLGNLSHMIALKTAPKTALKTEHDTATA